MDLSVIIVNFNVKTLLRDCLKSVISEQEPIIRRKPITDYRSPVIEIIVVDNASTDGSVEYLEKITDGKVVQTILLKKNFGFAKAVNVGIRKAKGEYILLLNPDTEVKPGALEKLVNFAQKRPEAGVIGARLLNPEGKIQPSVYHLPTAWRAIREYWLGQRGAYEKYVPEGQKPVEVETVTGAAMFIPKKVIEKAGFLDERYFMYFEDLDYCHRVRKAGFKVYYLPTAKIIHFHGASAREARAYPLLAKSSKIYHGLVKYYLLSFIIWSGQKWQKILGKK